MVRRIANGTLTLRLDSGDFAIRDADWDETSDFLRVGQCVRMDWSEQGHGTMLRAYSSNLNPDHYRWGAIGKVRPGWWAGDFRGRRRRHGSVTATRFGRQGT